MSFYTEYIPDDINLDDFIKDKDQYRDGKTRYTNPKTHDRMIKSLFKGNSVFLKRVEFEKKDGKYIIDCNVYSFEHKVTLNNNELLKCKKCGIPNMMHGKNHEFEQRQQNVKYRKIHVPEWLSQEEIVFINKKDDDVI